MENVETPMSGFSGNANVPPATTDLVTALVTPETLVNQLLPFVQAALDNSKGTGLTFANVVLIAMQSVEKYSDQIAKLAGPDKLQAAKLLVPNILHLAVQNGVTTQDQADLLSSQFNAGADVVGTLVNAFIAISKNPEVIQAVHAVKENISGCIASCKARAAAKKAAQAVQVNRTGTRRP